MSRAGALQAVCRRHESAAAAARAGNYYVAATSADAAPEMAATALALAGCHRGALAAFAEVDPQTPLAVFAKGLALLFCEGRSAALAHLAGGKEGTGPVAALRAVLEDGRVTINFVTSWRHWLERVDRARQEMDGHGLDVAVRTVSFHDGADLRVDFNAGDFARQVDGRGRGGHGINFVFDHYEMLPDGFFRSGLPCVKVFADFHHAALRNLEDLHAFDHVYCCDPETHQAIRDLAGRDTDIFLPLSDFTRVPALPPATTGVDLFFSGAILKDFSPRREAFIARVLADCPDAATIFVDGKLPRDQYERLAAGCRLEPVFLEAGVAIPSPRFFQRLNAGRPAIVDDPEFFALAFPDHASLFVGIDRAIDLLAGGTAVADHRNGVLPGRASEMPPTDQLLHMALVAPLLRPAGGRHRGEPPARIRSSGWNALFAVQPASGLGPMWQRANRLAAVDGPPVAGLDAARFFADAGRALQFHLAGGASIPALGADVLSALAAIRNRAAALGWQPVALRAAFRQSRAMETLCLTAMAILHAATARHPACLMLHVERLRMATEMAEDPAAAGRLAGDIRAQRGDLRAALAESDPAEVGLSLADRLARDVLATDRLTPAALQALLETALWDEVDLLEARAARRAGDPAAAFRLARTVLERSPGQLWAGDLLSELWRETGAAGRLGGADRKFFRHALGALLNRSPARIERYVLPLVEAALGDGDRGCASRLAGRFRTWAARVHPTGRQAEQRADRLAALERLKIDGA